MGAREVEARDAEVEAGRARFRRLPERIRFEDMVEMKDVSAHGGPAAFDAERSYVFFSCLALDQGL